MSIAIITGASAGLGRSFFHSLQKRHPDLSGIWLIARRRERLEELAADSPIPVTVLALDLLDAASYDLLGEKLAEEKATVKILINNAGFGAFGLFAETPLETELNMLDLNVRAVHILTKLFLLDLPPVVNILSERTARILLTGTVKDDTIATTASASAPPNVLAKDRPIMAILLRKAHCTITPRRSGSLVVAIAVARPSKKITTSITTP